MFYNQFATSVDRDIAEAWMDEWRTNNNATTFVFTPIGNGTSHTYNCIPFQIDGIKMDVDSSHALAMINLTVKYAKAVHILEYAGYAPSVLDDKRIGRVNVFYCDGTYATLDLIMGANIAEWNYDRRSLQSGLRHSKVKPAFSWSNMTGGQEYKGHMFYGEIATNPEKPLDDIELILDPNAGNIHILIRAIR